MDLLEERIKYAKIYLEKYDEKTQMSNVKSQIFAPSVKQKEFLKILKNKLEALVTPTQVVVQTTVFDAMKEADIKPREAFTAFYQSLTGKPFGPKAGELIMNLGLKQTISQLTASSSSV